MGTAVGTATTSPASCDAFSDVDAFVDEVMAELAAMATDGTCPTRGAEAGADGSTVAQGDHGDLVRRVLRCAVAFSPAEAKRLADRLEIHHTPKHGSWLNMAEIKFSALARQCLERRIAKPETLRKGVEHWERDRNAAQTRIVWQFKTEDARIKLQSLYPSYQG
jgi:hypothetical protein